MTEKRWILQTQDERLVRELSSSLNISEIVSKILINRGITSVQAAREFLDLDLERTPDPFLMLGMDVAVKRIEDALSKGEPIIIYGDYDADGQTSTALLMRVFRKLSANPQVVGYYLPDRLHEGYGLHKEALHQLAEITSLIITVDCGISSLEEVEYANELGIDIIITDHHEPGSTLPSALAILNPKQQNCPYPHKDLAGVGVACKLVQGMGLSTTEWKRYLDIVALGTVADLVPLRGENRLLVYHGLKQMEKTDNLGIAALLEVSNVDQPSAGHLGFRLGPRLNAVGRLGDPTRGVRLLLTEKAEEAKKLAQELNAENSERQDLEQNVLQAAEKVVETYDLHNRPALVVWGENWHQGVVGIVASRLVEKFYLPTVVISLRDGQGVASARSIEGLDLYETLTKCAPLLAQYGGHPMAAGLSLPEENLREFQRTFETLCAESLSPEDYVQKLYLDGTIKLDELTFDLIEDLACLEPYGFSNPSPLMQTQVSVLRTRRVGDGGKHLKLFARDHSCQEIEGIGFGLGGERALLEKHAEDIDLAFVPDLHEWNNKKKVQLLIRAWKPRSKTSNYVYKWMVDNYPWDLTDAHFHSKAIDSVVALSIRQPNFSLLDLRGIWNKYEHFIEKHNLTEKTLILVNTPAKALEVCRQLRIQVPSGENAIAFEHELLSPEERSQFNEMQPYWLVSTGFELHASKKWSSIWLWDPPLNSANYSMWTNLLEDGGELVLAFGPKELREAQINLAQIYPDRKTLARIYSLLKQIGDEVSIDLARERLNQVELVRSLSIASGVFFELGLWKITQDSILFLPSPAQKLDLNESVLYNSITQIRKQSLNYLKHCLERGFFQNESEREN